jgi:hypothetical protein
VFGRERRQKSRPGANSPKKSVVASAPLHLVGEVCGMWDGRRDRVFFFVLRLDELPTLRLDNREIVGARLVPINDLHKVPLTGPVEAYIRGQYSPTNGGAAA